jgi:hypothetical protein
MVTLIHKNVQYMLIKICSGLIGGSLFGTDTQKFSE